MSDGSDIDDMFSSPGVAAFFEECQTLCVPGCCSIGAYGPPAFVALGALADIASDQRCAMARRMRAVIGRLRSGQAAPGSAYFNCTWTNGEEAAQWIESWVVWIEFSLGLVARPRE
ncbi:MAG: hypothetical protein JNK05_17255 [Myxococcales bacterium]|nr:hypothetical protein [Myxococcales bacterium]